MEPIDLPIPGASANFKQMAHEQATADIARLEERLKESGARFADFVDKVIVAGGLTRYQLSELGKRALCGRPANSQQVSDPAWSDPVAVAPGDVMGKVSE